VDWDSKVGIAIRYGLDVPGIESLPVGSRFSSLVQTDPGAHPASCTVSFPGLKQPGPGVDQTTPSNAEVKNEWNCTFMTCSRANFYGFSIARFPVFAHRVTVDITTQLVGWSSTWRRDWLFLSLQCFSPFLHAIRNILYLYRVQNFLPFACRIPTNHPHIHHPLLIYELATSVHFSNCSVVCALKPLCAYPNSSATSRNLAYPWCCAALLPSVCNCGELKDWGWVHPSAFPCMKFVCAKLGL
jgi:hypothetical protein